LLDEENSGAASKAAKITDVGNMRDEESVGVESGKR
jgi:hypothetical protein